MTVLAFLWTTNWRYDVDKFIPRYKSGSPGLRAPFALFFLESCLRKGHFQGSTKAILELYMDPRTEDDWNESFRPPNH